MSRTPVCSLYVHKNECERFNLTISNIYVLSNSCACMWMLEDTLHECIQVMACRPCIPPTHLHKCIQIQSYANSMCMLCIHPNYPIHIQSVNVYTLFTYTR